MSDYLIIDENTIYEIDPECLKLKEKGDEAAQIPKETEKTLKKQSISKNSLLLFALILYMVI